MRSTSQEAATLLDILIDGFEKNEVFVGFHRRELPMPDESAAGVRRPFQIDHDLERLLDAYRNRGGGEVAAEHVHVYELGLIAGWYREAVSGPGAHSPQHELDCMRSLLRRLR